MNKSKIAPTTLQVKQNYMIIGDKYVRNYLVTSFPEQLHFGFLSRYISNPNIKVFIKTNILNYDMSKALKKEYQQKLDELNKTTDPTLRQKLEKQIEGYENHIQDMIQSNDKMLDLIMIFQVTSFSLDSLNEDSEQLKSYLNTNDIRVSAVSTKQEELMRVTSPLFIDSKLDNTLVYNYGYPFSVTTFCGMWAYNYQKLVDESGFLLGREKNNGGMIKFDPMFYNHNKVESVSSGRSAGNIVVFGKTGSGKTTTMNKIIRNFIKNKTKLIW
ncbi:MAG: hypothetical protein WBO70_00895, partial [Erysipelotrichaceae bacterium]